MDNLERFLAVADKGHISELDRLLRTLEINKVESEYQEPDKPPIFVKEYEECGLVRKFSINPAYEGKVPQPRKEFTEAEYDNLLSLIGEEIEEGDNTIRVYIKMMMIIGQLESRLEDEFRKRGKSFDKGPIILKEIDANGFVKGYAINTRYYIG